MTEIVIRPSAVARKLGLAAVALVLASIAGQVARFTLDNKYINRLAGLFFVDTERNITTFFSVLLIALAAQILGAIYLLQRKHRRPMTSHWAILSFLFFLLAFDESFSFHERLIGPTRALLGEGDLGVLYFAWVIPAMVFVIAVGLFFLPFLLGLPRRTRFGILLAAIIYVGGALGIELIGGYYVETHGLLDLYLQGLVNVHTWIYNIIIVTVEEFMEMAGTIVFIWALLKFVSEEHKSVQLEFPPYAQLREATIKTNSDQRVGA